MNNKIINIQEMLFKEMKRLDNDDVITSKDYKKELARSTALYNQTTAFIKTVNANIKLMEMAKQDKNKSKELLKYLGLE